VYGNSKPRTILGPLSVYGVLALMGVVAPVIFIAANLTAAFSSPDYNFIQDSISSLALTPLGWVQTIGFMLMGLLIEAFVIGLIISIRGGWGFRLGAGILVFFGFGILLVGAFHTDPTGGPRTFEGMIHSAAAVVVFWLAPFASLLIAYDLRKDLYWKGFFLYTIIASAIALALMLGRLWLPDELSWFGLYERILTLDELIWVEVVAVRLLLLSLREVKKADNSMILGQG
jgi:hypothetical protein